MAFAIYAPKKKDSTYLLNIRQEPNETLKQYINSFRNAIL